MTAWKRWLIAAPLLILLVAPLFAQQTDEPEDEPEYSETVVVTASRTEQLLSESPAAITVLDSKMLEATPADDIGDYLRNVPGLNVSQMSARDVQVTSRGATNSLATSQLVLLDNRSLYLDFFGFVMWDFAPLDPNEIKQIEVVNGPGSAVWGANALTGVIHIITKAPKEMVGTTITTGAGELGTLQAAVTHAGVAGKVGYKVSASYYEQDPYPRPTGVIPGSVGPLNPLGTPYPGFQNGGTRQPKVNVRVDYDQDSGGLWSFGAGSALTDGIIHTGIGPFDIEQDTSLNFFKADWSKDAKRVTFFANLLDGDAANLLTVGADGNPLRFLFKTETFNLDYSDTFVVGTKHVFTYGANVRRNNYELSIAPLGEDRNELGAFIQDEMLLSDTVRWTIGVRGDDIDPLEDPVFSPRTSLLVDVADGQTLRMSFNRAFRAPSIVQNYLDATIFNQVTVPEQPSLGLPAFGVAFPSVAVGNVSLVEERLDAVELGWVGNFGNATVTANVYRNETTDSMDFFESAQYPVNPADPHPAGFPLLTSTVGLCPAGTPLETCDPDGPGAIPTGALYAGVAPSLPVGFSYRNIGEIVDQGVELSLNVRPTRRASIFFNYSYQDEPEVSGIPPEALPNGTIVESTNLPPRHRANVGFAWDGDGYNVSANVNHNDDAFWTDVLDSRFWGPTDSYTMVNLAAGVDLTDTVNLSVNAQNLFDTDVQQHIFGDFIRRKVSGLLRIRF